MDKIFPLMTEPSLISIFPALNRLTEILDKKPNMSEIRTIVRKDIRVFMVIGWLGSAAGCSRIAKE